jgi:hypothetical protein
MKKTMAIMLAIACLFGFTGSSYAGDEEWSTAGKALAIIEGARIITGGNLDLIGNVAGISGNRGWLQGGKYSPKRRDIGNRYAKHHNRGPKKVWIPDFIWKRKYIPEHEDYSDEYGTIIVEAHYIQYKVEDGGHWEYR